MQTWEFVEVRQNRSDKTASDDPNAPYHYTMRKNGDKWSYSSSLSYKELKPLMFHFGASKPEELAGKSFKSPREDSHNALNLLIVQIRHGGEYEPPSPRELYNILASSLAQLQIPDFSNVDDYTLYKAFAELFEGFKMKHEWFDWLKREIWAKSNGRLLLERADYKEFKMIIPVPVEYLVLIDQGLPSGKPTGDKKRLILSPYSKPVFFDKHR